MYIVIFVRIDLHDLGRVHTKDIHGSKEHIAYDYNIRSWLGNVDSPHFKEKLYYTDGSTPLYNGNISKMDWNTNGKSTQSYAFTYDKLNRLTAANYSPASLGNYTETAGYNKMGNITSLQRSSTLDNLVLQYTGNQLSSVIESGNKNDGFIKPSGNPAKEYVYNKNGALEQDFNQGITKIQYNLLNLPERIQFAYGHNTKYSYDASGMKHRVVHASVNSNLNVQMGQTATPASGQESNVLTTDYVGNIVYENNKLKYILNPEGYVTTNSANKYRFNYYLKDHLGNNRVVMEIDNSNSLVLQTTDYYPFGMPYANGEFPERQPYKFGGKELDEVHGLNWYDFEARQLSMSIPRFTTMDPLAEKYYSISPYAYCNNNPIRFKDPTGKEGIKYTDKDGNKIVESNVVVLITQKKEIPKNATAKQIAKIEKQNAKIEKQNNERVADVREKLSSAYSNAKNSKGEPITFKFNVVGVAVKNTSMTSVGQALKLGNQYGLPAKDATSIPGHASFENAIAAVVSQAGAGGNTGVATGPLVKMNFTDVHNAFAHEIGHTLGLGHPSLGADGGLMHYPPQNLMSSEVDEIWDKALNIN
ncbi:hypothetical protein FACS189437_01540 [Bacteroidia bacterium]|nr:hypothetical protein FACS189437_01540 [Bacteroidia bacterium]